MISVTEWCPITRVYRTMIFAISKQEYDVGMAAWKAGTLIENAFPTLNAGEREFLRTGMMPDVWNFVHGKDDDNA